MGWQPIQTVRLELSDTWQRLPNLLNGGTVLKVEQAWDPSMLRSFPGRATLLFCEIYGDDTRYNFRKLYPYRGGRLLSFMPPEPFIKSGLLVRDLALRPSTRSCIMASANWRAAISLWDGAVSDLPEGVYGPDQLPPPVPVFDGGTY